MNDVPLEQKNWAKAQFQELYSAWLKELEEEKYKSVTQEKRDELTKIITDFFKEYVNLTTDEEKDAAYLKYRESISSYTTLEKSWAAIQWREQYKALQQ